MIAFFAPQTFLSFLVLAAGAIFFRFGLQRLGIRCIEVSAGMDTRAIKRRAAKRAARG